MYVISTK